MHQFDQDIAVESANAHCYTGAIATNWSINSVPNGGLPDGLDNKCIVTVQPDENHSQPASLPAACRRKMEKFGMKAMPWWLFRGKSPYTALIKSKAQPQLSDAVRYSWD